MLTIYPIRSILTVYCLGILWAYCGYIACVNKRPLIITQTTCPQYACNIPKQYSRNMLAMYRNNIPAKRLQYTQTICPQYACNIPKQYSRKTLAIHPNNMLAIYRNNIPAKRLQYTQTICPQYTQTVYPQYTGMPQIKGFVYENKSKLRFIK